MPKITGDQQRQNHTSTGKGAFLNVTSYYLTRPLLTPYVLEYRRTVRIVEEPQPDYRSLMKRFCGPLLELHKPTEEQNHTVELKCRRVNLVRYDHSTLENLIIKRVDGERIIINASITRFNRLTGTGRLILEEDSGPVSFEPVFLWREFPVEQKRKLSRNLDVNTDNESLIRLCLGVTTIRNFLSEIKKYSLHRVVMDQYD